MAVTLTHAEALRILGISADADCDHIKAAFRECALRYHPDSSGDRSAESARRFQQAVDAYKVAMREAIRLAQDRRLRGGLHGLSPGELARRNGAWKSPSGVAAATARIRRRRRAVRAGWMVAACLLLVATLGATLAGPSNRQPRGRSRNARLQPHPRTQREARLPRWPVERRTPGLRFGSRAEPGGKAFRLGDSGDRSEPEQDPNRLPEWAQPTGRSFRGSIVPAPGAPRAPQPAAQLRRPLTGVTASFRLPSWSATRAPSGAAAGEDEMDIADDPVIAPSAGILRKWNLTPDASQQSPDLLRPARALRVPGPTPPKPYLSLPGVPRLGDASRQHSRFDGLESTLRIAPPVVRAARREHVQQPSSNLMSGRTRVNYIDP